QPLGLQRVFDSHVAQDVLSLVGYGLVHLRRAEEVVLLGVQSLGSRRRDQHQRQQRQKHNQSVHSSPSTVSSSEVTSGRAQNSAATAPAKSTAEASCELPASRHASPAREQMIPTATHFSSGENTFSGKPVSSLAA